MLKQFFSYFGSKVALSINYPPPQFEVIVEPFSGSAGYACRYPDSEVRLFDVDPIIVGVWHYLIRATRLDVLSLPLAPSDVAGLSKAERDLIGFWWRRGGAEPCAKPVPWMLSGKYPYSFWGELTRERIANQVHRINHWTCTLASYQEIPVAAATWFIDPPYQLQGKRYKHGSTGINYLDLGAWVRTLPGQKIVCEAAGADWLPFVPLYKNRTVKYLKSDRVIQEMVFLHSDPQTEILEGK
jgi:site-specific DNA-adenine methylase